MMRTDVGQLSWKMMSELFELKKGWGGVDFGEFMA